MRRTGAIAALLAVATVGSACGRTRGELTEAQAAELATREQRLAARLAAGAQDTAPKAPLARWVLPPELREISGLAITADGRVLAHNDEQGAVFVIDARRGVVLKQFMIGKAGMRGDFEGIATAGPDIYMLTSNGTIYRFREGNNGDRVSAVTIDTRLGRECEFEGIVVEPGNARLLLPCKRVGKEGPRDQLVIYRWDLRSSGGQQASMLTIPLADVIGANDWKNLHPSDMTIDPASGNYVLIAAQEKALVEITPSGEVVHSGPLPEPSQQAEGVAITNDGILIISDEAKNRAATISLYRWPLGAAAKDSVQQSTPPGESP